MRRTVAVLTLVLCAVVGVAIAGGIRNLAATLSGYQEVPTLSTSGHGQFHARVNPEGTAVDWKLSYADTETPVTQAHIHFGARALNGPVVVFLCSNLGNGPAGTQACPAGPATIEGTIMAADVLGGAAAQGLEAGNLEELIAAMANRATYANVHTTGRAGGEIRGQVAPRGHHRDDKDKDDKDKDEKDRDR